MMIPGEIKTMEKRTAAIAAKMKSDDPGAFRDINVDGRNIHFVQVAEGTAPKPLVLFIHGSPGAWEVWDDYLIDPELKKRAEMIAVDRPGFGGSGGGNVERSLKKQSQQIARLLDNAQPGQRVIVVGHSYGGPVAARLAMDNPAKITDVIILAGSIDPAQEHTKWYQYPADWFIFSWMIPKDLVVANREIRPLKMDLEEMIPLWPQVTQRVTVIQGEKDDLVPPANADFAAKHITRAASLDIIRIPGQNHFLPWNQYSLVKSEILKHLGPATETAASPTNLGVPPALPSHTQALP